MTGYTETILGRRRYLPDLTSDNRQRREMAERMALNAPIQGSAADIIKVAMLSVRAGDRGRGAARRGCCCRCTTSWCSRWRRGSGRRSRSWSAAEMAGAADLLGAAGGVGRLRRELGRRRALSADASARTPSRPCARLDVRSAAADVATRPRLARSAARAASVDRASTRSSVPEARALRSSRPCDDRRASIAHVHGSMHGGASRCSCRASSGARRSAAEPRAGSRRRSRRAATFSRRGRRSPASEIATPTEQVRSQPPAPSSVPRRERRVRASA